MVRIHQHEMGADVFQGIALTAWRLIPGRAQDLPAQGIVLAKVSLGDRFDDVQLWCGQAKITQVVAIYLTPASSVTPRCSCVQNGGNSSSLPASGVIFTCW